MSEASNIRVSVLVPVFNGAASIVRALHSVLEQTIEGIEIIVIDDASEDGTFELVQRLASEDSHIKLIKLAKNVGPGLARTVGLRRALGEWVAILDADDWIAPDRLKQLIDEAEANKLDAIADNLALVDPGLGEVVGTAFPLVQGETFDVTAESFLDNTRPGARVNLGWMQPLIRREFLLQHNIEWPSLRHAEDMVFQMRLLMAGARFQLVGQAMYHYTQRRGTASGQVSKHSRTKRSIKQQHKSLDLILADPCAVGLSRRAKKRLARMYGEISATTHALNTFDRLARWHLLRAVMSGFLAISRSLALLRCLIARYMVGFSFRG